MKSHRLLPLILACLAFAGPAFPAGPKIGVLLKGKSDFWTAVAHGASAAGAKVGAEVLIKSPPSETDVGIQIRLLASLVDQGIQALVIAPCNQTSLAAPVAAAAAKGIKIVVIDSPLDGNLPVVFVGTDHQAAGNAAGKLVASMVGDGDEVAILRHAQTGGATEARERGALDSLLAAHPHLIIHGDIYASSVAGAEADRAQLVLTRYPQAKVVFASATPGTMAMLKVLSSQAENTRPKLVGCGFNLNAEVVAGLQSGALTGWIAQQPDEVGAKGVEAANSLLAGQAVPPVISTNFIVVTKANLDDPAVQRLLAL